MTDYWITTHWPTPTTDPPLSRHVYAKERRSMLPKPGAVVFIREAIDAKDRENHRVRTVARHYRGKVLEGLKMPKGSGGIIGVVIVDGPLRKHVPADVVFDFGDLREWFVIPCRDFQPASLSLDDLRNVIEKENVRGLNLWPMPDLVGSKLLKAIRIRDAG